MCFFSVILTLIRWKKNKKEHHCEEGRNPDVAIQSLFNPYIYLCMVSKSRLVKPDCFVTPSTSSGAPRNDAILLFLGIYSNFFYRAYAFFKKVSVCLFLYTLTLNTAAFSTEENLERIELCPEFGEGAKELVVIEKSNEVILEMPKECSPSSNLVDGRERLQMNSTRVGAHFFWEKLTAEPVQLSLNLIASIFIFAGAVSPMLNPWDPRYSSSYLGNPFVWLSPIGLFLGVYLAFTPCVTYLMKLNEKEREAE